MTHTQTTYTNRIALRAGKKGARPAEVGALASVFEKSATELKQSKLLKCKQTLQIATFNVRTLNRIGQLLELIASAEEHKIDIICIQEHRYTHTEDIKYHETGNGWSLATVSAWKNSVNAAVGGVGLLIGPRALKTLNSVEKIQPRMMAATFNGNPRATIISCYSPTNEVMAMKGQFTFPKAPVLDLHHQMFLWHQDTRWRRSLTPLQKCSWRVLQPRQNGLNMNWGFVANMKKKISLITF